jgi:hypothetical protein
MVEMLYRGSLHRGKAGMSDMEFPRRTWRDKYRVYARDQAKKGKEICSVIAE